MKRIDKYLNCLKDGLSATESAKLLDVDRRTIGRWRQQLEKDGLVRRLHSFGLKYELTAKGLAAICCPHCGMVIDEV